MFYSEYMRWKECIYSIQDSNHVMQTNFWWGQKSMRRELLKALLGSTWPCCISTIHVLNFKFQIHLALWLVCKYLNMTIKEYLWSCTSVKRRIHICSELIFLCQGAFCNFCIIASRLRLYIPPVFFHCKCEIWCYKLH